MQSHECDELGCKKQYVSPFRVILLAKFIGEHK